MMPFLRCVFLGWIVTVFTRLRTLLSSPPGHGKGPRDPIGGFIPLADFIKRIPYAKI